MYYNGNNKSVSSTATSAEFIRDGLLNSRQDKKIHFNINSDSDITKNGDGKDARNLDTFAVSDSRQRPLSMPIDSNKVDNNNIVVSMQTLRFGSSGRDYDSSPSSSINDKRSGADTPTPKKLSHSHRNNHNNNANSSLNLNQLISLNHNNNNNAIMDLMNNNNTGAKDNNSTYPETLSLLPIASLSKGGRYHDSKLSTTAFVGTLLRNNPYSYNTNTKNINESNVNSMTSREETSNRDNTSSHSGDDLNNNYDIHINNKKRSNNFLIAAHCRQQQIDSDVKRSKPKIIREPNIIRSQYRRWRHSNSDRNGDSTGNYPINERLQHHGKCHFPEIKSINSLQRQKKKHLSLAKQNISNTKSDNGGSRKAAVDYWEVPFFQSSTARFDRFCDVSPDVRRERSIISAGRVFTWGGRLKGHTINDGTTVCGIESPGEHSSAGFGTELHSSESTERGVKSYTQGRTRFDPNREKLLSYVEF